MVRVVIIRSYMHREREHQENRCRQITRTDAGTVKNQQMGKETDFGLRLNPKGQSNTETRLENALKAEIKPLIKSKSILLPDNSQIPKPSLPEVKPDDHSSLPNVNQISFIPQNSRWKEFMLSIDSLAESWTYIFDKHKYHRQKIGTLRKQAKIQEQMAQDLDSDFNITIHDPRYSHYTEALDKL
jgi:hypothetical protein